MISNMGKMVFYSSSIIFLSDRVYNGSSLVSGGSEFKFMGRTCVTPDQCFSGSVNFGFAQVVINSKCCTSDLCNSQDVPGNLQHVSWYFEIVFPVVINK